jgi:hypothetical protein
LNSRDFFEVTAIRVLAVHSPYRPLVLKTVALVLSKAELVLLKEVEIK